VGFLVGRKRQDSSQFLNATGSMPLWICIAACVAANCGSMDVIVMMALGAQYGILACHFYWIGAIPALVVLAFWLLPAYAQRRYPTVLDFIANYYGTEVRAIVALGMSVIMLLLAGACLCAAAQVLQAFLGWTFFHGVLLTALVVLFYTWKGGLRATVYNELLHFAIVLIAVAPLSFLVVRDFGGFGNLLRRIPADRAHAWQTLPVFAPHATMDLFGLIFGLGLVLSFGYWSTDFVLMQRALAVRRHQSVQYVPLAIAGAKLIFAMLIVIPGLVAPLVLGMHGAANWNATLPSMMLHYYSPAWIVIGVMGLAASLVSTFANNISGFSAAWVQGIYRQWICTHGDDRHYVVVGRCTNAAAILLSISGAYLAVEYKSLMEYMQMLFSVFNAPLFALVALAALAPRQASRGGMGGFVLGLLSTILHQILVHAGLVSYGSLMSANFYGAILGFSVAVIATLAIGRLRDPAGFETRTSLVRLPVRFSVTTVLVALGILFVGVAFNVIFR
jgi:SSS family solute:Na+ symporter